MKMEFVHLSLAQKELIKPLWQQLNQTHHQRSNHWKDRFRTFTFEQRMKPLLKRDGVCICVVKENDHFIGYCIMSHHEGAGEIDSIYIDERYRSQGIGKQLLIRAQQWFEKQEISDIFVEIVEGNEAVFSFYEDVGFRKYVTVFKNTG